MVNSLRERAAAASFGFMPSAGTRAPHHTTSFLRGTTLSCYHVGIPATPVDGWSIGRAERVFEVGHNIRVFTVG